MLPNAVGNRPNVPLTSGCTVSPKYTGNDKEAIPTQNPDKARPIKEQFFFIKNLSIT